MNVCTISVSTTMEPPDFSQDWLDAFAAGPMGDYTEILMRPHKNARPTILAMWRDAIAVHPGHCPIRYASKRAGLEKRIAGQWVPASTDDFAAINKAFQSRLMHEYVAWGDAHGEELRRNDLLHRRYAKSMVRAAEFDVYDGGLLRDVARLLCH